jgi:hypothetical protein
MEKSAHYRKMLRGFKQKQIRQLAESLGTFESLLRDTD